MLIPVTTPFEPGGDVDVPGLQGNIRKWASTGVRGFVVGGSTGEAVLLDEDERVAVWEAVRDAAPSGLLLVAGTGAESRRAALRLSRTAADLDYDAVLVQPPAFYKSAMTPAVVRDHYRAVADDSAVPVVVYQVPTRFCTLDLPTGLVAELSSHDNIAGIKDSRGKLDTVAELATAVREGFQVLVGSGSLLYPALEVGAAGGILGVANFAPGLCARICDAHAAGDAAAAGAAQEVAGPLHNAIVGGMGVAGVKCALDLLGFAGREPRPPLPPLPATRRREVARLLEAAGLSTATEESPEDGRRNAPPGA